MTAVHVVLPDGIDDPVRPSGGNVYDRRVCRGLSSLGWWVHEHAVPVAWPFPDASSHAVLAEIVERIPDGSLVLLDGLIASAAPEVLVPEASRLRLVVLVHMPLGHLPPEGGAGEVRSLERAMLSSAAAVIATSSWARCRLLELYALPSERVHVAQPSVDPVDLSHGSVDGAALLTVGAVIAGKGHDVLLEALAATDDLAWSCVCVGSLEREPAFVEALRARVRAAGLSHRVQFTGPRSGAALDECYAAADLLVQASRSETYGMVVIEALARGLPVVASDVGGLPEALGHGADGSRPGLLVPAGESGALAAALRAWLGDGELRERLRRSARERRESLSGWSTTTSALADVLAGASR